MRTKVGRMALLCLVMGSMLGMGLVAPVHATGTLRISGSGYYDDAAGTECGVPPAEFSSYPGLVLSGDLVGCLFTDVQGAKFHEAPSGIYIETGRELVVASLNGAPEASFETTYRFESKWDPDAASGVEVMGRCQHPLTAGSGTDVFMGATGRLDFKDEVSTGLFYYRGHITLA